MTQTTFDGTDTATAAEPDDQFNVDDLLGETSSSDGEDAQADLHSVAMFEGDTGQLYPEQRRCLHALLKYRYISAEQHPEHWAVLLNNHPLIKSRLNDMFLDLEINRGYRVAFKRQASTDTGERLPSLLRDLSHTKEETIVMMHLRRRFFTQQQEGEDYVFVDRIAMLEEVAEMRPENSTNRAMDRKRAEKAIESLTTAGVLIRTGDPDRFRISPIIDVLLPIERQRALWDWFRSQNNTERSAGEGEGGREAVENADDADDQELNFESEEEQA